MLPRKISQAQIYDVSVPIHPAMPVYPGNPDVRLSLQQSIANGNLANVSSASFGTHTGTHLDAPNHVDNSWPSLQDIDLTVMLGPATVFELGVARAITASDIADLPWDGVERVLFKTRNSQLWEEPFHEDFVYLSDEAARFLTQNTGVKLVGIDYLSIEQFGVKQMTAHLELLGHGIPILEGLDLSSVSAGEYYLICLPIKLANADAAPVRALLIRY